MKSKHFINKPLQWSLQNPCRKTSGLAFWSVFHRRPALAAKNSTLSLLCLVCSWYSAQPDAASPLQCGAAAGEGHTHVPGHQGLPLGLEAELEGGREQQELRGEPEPCAPGEGRPLQLEQHPHPHPGPVEEGGKGHLWGHTGQPASRHSEYQDGRLLRVETDHSNTLTHTNTHTHRHTHTHADW